MAYETRKINVALPRVLQWFPFSADTIQTIQEVELPGLVVRCLNPSINKVPYNNNNNNNNNNNYYYYYYYTYLEIFFSLDMYIFH